MYRASPSQVLEDDNEFADLGEVVTRGRCFAISDKRAPVYTISLLCHVFESDPHKNQILLGEPRRGVC